jgi:hypothetical protein
MCYVSTTTRRVNEKNVRIVEERLPLAGRAAPTASAEKKMLGFRARVHALFELAIWIQAGEDRAIAAGSQAGKKTGCRPLVVVGWEMGVGGGLIKTRSRSWSRGRSGGWGWGLGLLVVGVVGCWLLGLAIG